MIKSANGNARKRRREEKTFRKEVKNVKDRSEGKK